MQVHEPENSGCGCYAAELKLFELMSDPMTLSLMSADRVDRRELSTLLDKARCGLRQRQPARTGRAAPQRRMCA